MRYRQIGQHLHNSVVTVMDETGRVVAESRLVNDCGVPIVLTKGDILGQIPESQQVS